MPIRCLSVERILTFQASNNDIFSNGFYNKYIKYYIIIFQVHLNPVKGNETPRELESHLINVLEKICNQNLI